MTGPDHYVTAESFADAAAQAQLRDDLAEAAALAAIGQVHATLALTAATALAAVVPISRGNYPAEVTAWLDATGVVDEL